MTIAYIDVAKAPVQVPVIDLLQEPQGAAFDFISGQAWIVDKVNPANTMLRNIGDVLTNPGASPTKLLRRKSGLLESAPWWANEYDVAGNPMGMRTEAQRTRINRYPTQIENAAWQKFSVDVVQVDGQPGLSSGNVRKVVASAVDASHVVALPCTFLDTVPIYSYTAIVEYDGTPYAFIFENLTSSAASNRFGVQIDMQTGAIVAQSVGGNVLPPIVSNCGPKRWAVTIFFAGKASTTRTAGIVLCNSISVAGSGSSLAPDVYVGDGVSGVKVWHAQVEPNPFPSSPILGDETATAGVTRAADQPQIPTGFLPFSANEGTLILDGMAYDYDAGSVAYNHSLAFRSISSSAYFAGIGKNDISARNAALEGTARNSGSPYASALITTSGAYPVGSPKKAAYTWGGDGSIIASGVTGEVVQSSTPFTNNASFPFTLLRFNFENGIMWYRSAIYIPRKLTASELIARVRP